MALSNLADAFNDELRDMLGAQRQLVKALRKMAKHASCEKLSQALKKHLAETRLQVERVEQAFEETGKSAKAKTCEAMKGLITEAEAMLGEEGEPAVKEALIIACAQKVEHYEIATYGTLCTWAETLGYVSALKLLKKNINEEETTDKILSELAKSINMAALTATAI